MTEKVIFEFSVLNEKDGVKYEIRQGSEKSTCSGHFLPRCFPLAFTPRLKILSGLHRRFMENSQKRIRKTLNTLERIYTDFYGNENATLESDNHG